ncbi:response regulator [Roseivirga sp. BDSF3-8]|uniref:response regulator n=1 Tax=Roseivirga sp. BDSF3-8 TaxID=3241598 RepID=UPI0035326BC9
MQEINIFLVEDSIADIAMLEEVLLDSRLDINLETHLNGEEALEALRVKSPGELPDMILLDLNLPRVDGLDVLKEIKSHPSLMVIPVVIMSTSSNRDDIIKSYQGHANCFITKPSDFDQFEKVIEAIENFWFSIVKLPKEKNSDQTPT